MCINTVMHRLAVPAEPSACGYCGRRHRTYRQAARCRWRDALWVEGEGRWASVSLCPHEENFVPKRAVTVELYASREEALAAKARIDRGFCGNACRRLH